MITRVDDRGTMGFYLWESGERETHEFQTASEALQNLTGSDKAQHPGDWPTELSDEDWHTLNCADPEETYEP